MAVVQRYVNTASAGGDGTTNGTSGATAAYASLSSWEANQNGNATDDFVVDCCGTAADTTQVVVSFATHLTTGTYTIRGNRSDPSGFYSGHQVISPNHYRLSTGTDFWCLRADSERNGTIDGIQAEASHNNTNTSAISIPFLSPTIKNCRVRNTNGCKVGIGNDTDGGLQGTTLLIANNLVVGFSGKGIWAGQQQQFSGTLNIYHNTVYGNGSSIGIRIGQVDGVGNPFFNVKANAVANNSAGNDFQNGVLEDGATITVSYNAFEQASGTSNEISISTPANAWLSPGTAQDSDFTLKNSSSPLYHAAPSGLVSTDICDVTRNASTPHVGCFEFVTVESLGMALSESIFLSTMATNPVVVSSW